MNTSLLNRFSFPLAVFVAAIFLLLPMVPSAQALGPGESGCTTGASECTEGDCRASEGGCFCSGSALGPGTCEPRRGVGGDCSETGQCQDDLICNITPDTDNYLKCIEEPEEETPTETEGDTDGDAPRARTPASYGYNNPLGTTSVNQVINRIVRAALGVVGAVFLAMFVWGGVLWMTAGGDPEKIKKARQALINSVIGMAVVALSFTVLNVLFGIAGSLLG